MKPFTSSTIYNNSDYKAWTAEFIATIKKNPSIATDPDTLDTWFASAICRGFDHAMHSMKNIDGKEWRYVNGKTIYISDDEYELRKKVDDTDYQPLADTLDI